MDGAHPGQVAPIEDVPAAEIEDDQNSPERETAEGAGLSQPHHGELVLGDPIFPGFEFGQASGRDDVSRTVLSRISWTLSATR